jgi:hypothetical protein
LIAGEDGDGDNDAERSGPPPDWFSIGGAAAVAASDVAVVTATAAVVAAMAARTAATWTVAAEGVDQRA